MTELPIPYGRQEVTPEDIDAVVATLKSPFWTQGPAISQFEEDFAAYVGSGYALACSNGTAALHLACLALGLKSGQRVITSPLTFAASANCARYCGAEIDFIDIDPATGLLDLNLLREKLESQPPGTYAGVIPVDYAGYPLALPALKELATRFGLWVLEDACHAPGAGYPGVFRCGDGVYADASVFSFHPVKHIAAGEGGMVTCNCPDLFQRMKDLRSHGITRDARRLQNSPDGGWYYEMQALGWNYRLTDLQAALGRSQLSRARENLELRWRLAERYHESLRNLDLQLIRPPAGITHAYHLYVIRCRRRKALYDYLVSRQILAQVHYLPVHLHPYYRNLGWASGDFPQAEEFYQTCLSLPLFPSLAEAQQTYVIDSIREFFAQ